MDREIAPLLRDLPRPDEAAVSAIRERASKVLRPLGALARQSSARPGSDRAPPPGTHREEPPRRSPRTRPAREGSSVVGLQVPPRRWPRARHRRPDGAPPEARRLLRFASEPLPRRPPCGPGWARRSRCPVRPNPRRDLRTAWRTRRPQAWCSQYPFPPPPIGPRRPAPRPRAQSGNILGTGPWKERLREPGSPRAGRPQRPRPRDEHRRHGS